jgi:MoaA/NifB/PqqE/SkfB family radical SAM enzyme
MVFRNADIHRQNPMISILSKKPIRAFVNILKASLERRLRLVELRSLPFQLAYEPTTVCILECPTCSTGLGIIDRAKSRVDIDQFKATIDALADYVFYLDMYNWGEPLLHKDFAKLAKYATEKGIVVSISSNLSIRLDEKRCEEIIDSGLYFLMGCVDGATPKTHAFNRIGSNLQIVHENLRRLVLIKEKLNKHIPIIDVMYLMFAHNENEFETFQKQMEDIGVDSYHRNAPILCPDKKINKSSDPMYDYHTMANKTISEIKANGRRIKPCSWLYHKSVINPNGAISPCCAIQSEKNDFGQIYQTDNPKEILSQFRNEWNGFRYKAARRLFSNKERLKEWSMNLHDLRREEVFSTNKEVPLICDVCPFPPILYSPSQNIRSLFFIFARESFRCMKIFDIQGIIINSIKTIILMLAASLL